MPPTPTPASTDVPAVSFVEFDTSRFDRDLRYEAWRENIGVVFDIATTDGSLPQDYQARITAGHVGDVIIGLTSAPAQHFSRSSLRAWREEQDAVLVQVFLRGGGILSGTEKISAGDILVIDMNQAHDMVNTDFENLTLILSGQRHDKLVEMLKKLHDVRLPHDNPMVRLMRDYLLGLWRHLDDMSKLQADIAVQGALGLLQNWLAADSRVRDMSNPAIEKATTKSILYYIEQNLHQPLEPEDLTRIFKISRAQLYRLFQAYGGVACYLWERRLQHSLRMLSQPRFAKMRVAAIAFACGFSSEVHFSRRFRDKFGMTPGQAREKAQAFTEGRQANSGAPEEYLTEFRDLFKTFASL